MTEASLLQRDRSLTVGEIAALTGAKPRREADLHRRISGVAALDRATPDDLAFLANAKYADEAAHSDAGACLTSERLADAVPPRMALLVVREPYHAFVEVAQTLYPEALRPSSMFGASGIASGAFVHPDARMESGVTIDPGAVIGPGAEIGSGTVIGPAAVVGPHVCIGRDCAIGAHVTLAHALIGDRVIIHPGAAIGQDGFGFIMGPSGHRKVPQIGRVIIQDDVEIGAGTMIDRGANRDTVIGEGTKIDNQVQIGHNTQIGRHCVLVAQTGISGSVTVEDFVVLAARVGVINHITIGEGAQIAAQGNPWTDVPPGARFGGSPAKPMRRWLREVAMIERMTADGGKPPPDDVDQ